MLVSDATAYSLRIAGILGVGQTALPQDTADATKALEMMLDQWQAKRWIVYRLEELSVRVTPGKDTYTIGPGIAADVPFDIRPPTMESAFVRQLTGANDQSFPVDYPLRRIRSREEWNAISLKRLVSWPGAFFYDPTLPDGTFYIWPIPIQSFFELHFAVSAAITAPLDASTELLDFLPPETEEAITYNLAGRLRVNYHLPMDQALAAMARASLNTLRTTNFAMRPLQMPSQLRHSPRLKNPMGGFVPEVAATVGFQVLK